MPTPALPTFLAAAVATRANAADTRVLIMGDSTVYGQGSGSTSPTILGWVHQFANIIARDGSIQAAPGLLIPALSNGVLDPRWTGTSWSNTFTLGFGTRSCFSNATNTNPATFTPGAAMGLSDTYDVYYCKTTGAASFTVQATGGASSGTIVANTTAGIGKVTVTAGSASLANAVVFTPLSGAGVYILAVEPRLSTTKRLLAGNAGVPGAATIGWTQDGQANGQTLAGLASIQAYAPHLTLICLGKNDAGTSVDATTFSGRMNQIITAAKVSGDVVLCTFSPSTGSPYTANEPGIIAAIQTLATANSVPLIDPWTDLFGGVYDATYQFDALHENGAGYGRKASHAYLKLRRYLDWLFPAAGNVLSGIDRGNGDGGNYATLTADKVLAPNTYGPSNSITGTASQSGGGGYLRIG